MKRRRFLQWLGLAAVATVIWERPPAPIAQAREPEDGIIIDPPFLPGAKVARNYRVLFPRRYEFVDRAGTVWKSSMTRLFNVSSEEIKALGAKRYAGQLATSTTARELCIEIAKQKAAVV